MKLSVWMVRLSIIMYRRIYIGDLISEDNKLVTNMLRELNISPLDAFTLPCVEDFPIK